MVNETYQLQHFINKVIPREFYFDEALIGKLRTYAHYESCPHVTVTISGNINYLKPLKKKPKEHAVNLKLIPSGEEHDIVVKSEIQNFTKIFIDIHYENLIRKPQGLSFMDYVETQTSEAREETLEVRVWSGHKDSKDDTVQTTPTGLAVIPLKDAFCRDGKIHGWSLKNEFGNVIGYIPIMINFRNQHLPLPCGEISRIVCTQVFEGMMSILKKHDNFVMPNDCKLGAFNLKDINTRTKSSENFSLDVSYEGKDIDEFQAKGETKKSLYDDDLFVIHLYVNGKLAFEFGKHNCTATLSVIRSLNDRFELRVYRLIPKKKLETQTPKTLKARKILDMFTNKNSVKMKSFPPGTNITRTLSNASLSSFGSITSCLENTLQDRHGSKSSSESSLSIHRSFSELSLAGSCKKRSQKLKYELVFKKNIQLGDVPWRTGGLDVAYIDSDQHFKFEWHIELLHSSENLSNNKNEMVLSRNVANQLLYHLYHAEFNVMTPNNLSKWNGTLSKDGQNVLAILGPHYRFREWQAMIGWTLLKLHPLFPSLNVNQIVNSLKAMELKNLSYEKTILIENLQSFCVKNISHFDVTNSVSGAIRDYEYLKSILNVTNIVAPQIDESLKMELRENLVKVLMETEHASSSGGTLISYDLNSETTAIYFRNVNEVLVERYANTNLEFIAKHVDVRIGTELWRPILAQAVLDFMLPILQTKLFHLHVDEQRHMLCDIDKKEEEKYNEWGIISFKLYKHLTSLLKIAEIKEHSEQYKKFYNTFEPCLSVWAHACALTARERVRMVVKLEENKDLTFDSYSNTQITESLPSPESLSAMQGAIEVNGIFNSAQITWNEIVSLTPGRTLEFGKSLYMELNDVFQTYVQKLEEMVLRDDEYEPHELNYILKSMFHSVSFLDRFWERIQNEGNTKGGGADTNKSILVRENSVIEVARKTVQDLRDKTLHAFCKGQKKHLLYFLKHWREQNLAREEFFDRICIRNYSFHGYLEGLISYFERNLLEDIEDENVSSQLKICNQILKENILTIGKRALKEYYFNLDKCSCDKNEYEHLLETINEIRQLSTEHDLTGHSTFIDNLEKEINLKLSSSQYLVSNYLDKYHSLLTNTDTKSLNCFGEVSFNIGLTDNRLYVSLKSVHNLVPRSGYSTCSFSIQILLLPISALKNECAESEWTPMVDNKINYLFDISSPFQTAPKASRSALLKQIFTFTGLPKSYNKLEAYTVFFELEDPTEEPLKFLELRLYDHTLGSLIKKFRGQFILPLKKDNVPNINIMDDFLYGCNERFKINGKFFQYLEECNRTDKELKTLFNELCFRNKDAVACSFIKHQKRLSSMYDIIK